MDDILGKFHFIRDAVSELENVFRKALEMGEIEPGEHLSRTLALLEHNRSYIDIMKKTLDEEFPIDSLSDEVS